MPRLSLLTTTALLALSALGANALSDIETQFTAKSILAVAPETATCDSSLPECATAAVAAPNIAISFYNFGITSFGAQAAILSLILFESGSFKYSRNHFPAPGKPGQGTRNMQSPAYNLKYAQWLASVCKNCGISADQVAAADKSGPADVLALVNGDQWGFGSASWFLKTQCDASILAGLADASEVSWEAYIGCIGTTVTDDRKAGWQKVVALGKW